MNEQELIKHLQTDFYSFYLHINSYLEGDNFVTGEWEQELCDWLQFDVYKAFLEGKRPVATSEEPVQHGKSRKLRIFLAWLLGLHSNLRFNFYTSSDELRRETSDMLSLILGSEAYKSVFGSIISKKTLEHFNLKQNGKLDLRLTGEGNTGYPSHISIIDDPYRNSDDAYSETIRTKIENRVRSDIFSRRQNNTMVIILHSRWHIDDLIGTFKRDPIFKEKELLLLSSFHPALSDDNKALFPALRDERFLSEQRKILGEIPFNALYQQNPQIIGGNLFKRDWWRFYYTNDIKYQKIFIVGDTAQKTKEHNDYTAFTCWGLTHQKELYLLDLLHGKFEAPELKTQAKAFWNKWQNRIQGQYASALYIEDKASGTGLIQELQREGGIPILPVPRDKDKLIRVLDTLPWVESGHIYLPISAENSISKAVMDETAAFSANMTHKHDDITDTVCDAVDIVFKKPPSIFDVI